MVILEWPAREKCFQASRYTPWLADRKLLAELLYILSLCVLNGSHHAILKRVWFHVGIRTGGFTSEPPFVLHHALEIDDEAENVVVDAHVGKLGEHLDAEVPSSL